MMEDLDQDIRDFIERETQDNIERGMSPEEARYAALRNSSAFLPILGVTAHLSAAATRGVGANGVRPWGQRRLAPTFKGGVEPPHSKALRAFSCTGVAKPQSQPARMTALTLTYSVLPCRKLWRPIRPCASTS